MPTKRSGDRLQAVGPTISAGPLWGPSKGKWAQLLSDDERARLAVIASVVRFKKGVQIYWGDHDADAVFIVISGVVKAFGTASDGTERIVAFLFADDLFGLSEAGKYSNSAKAVTSVTAYRLPVRALESKLPTDAAIEFQVICKLCNELREAQRHAFLLGQHQALGKAAMFLQLLEQHQVARGEDGTEVYLPMTRSDIAAYIAISPEAVSRSFRALEAAGLIRFRDKRHVRILDRPGFDKLIAKGVARSPLRR